MRLVAVLLAAGILTTASCSRPAPSAPTESPSTPAAPAQPGPTLVRIWLCCGRNSVAINTQRQIEARATYSDGSIRDITSAVTAWTSSNPAIAPIMSTGVVTGVRPGDFRISGTYSELAADWDLYVFQSPFRPPEANEVTGFVREISGLGPIDLGNAEVEVVGGPASGRKVLTTTGGIFRIDGLQAAGFDLIVRKRGYAPGRAHVLALGVEMSINLVTAPGVVSDILEGEVCWPTRTISRVFRPAAPGFLRITGQRYQSATRALFADGVLVDVRVYDNQDIELAVGVRYELRVTGSCDYNPSPTVRVGLLRPAG